MHVFWQKGYYNTSMQDLVDGMQICRASLYDTFGDKHALYLKALTYYGTLNADAITQAIEQQTTARAKINAVFDRLIDDVTGDADQKGCFINSAALEMLPEHDPTVGQLVCRNFAVFETAFSDLLQQGIASGEFRATLPLADTAGFLLSVTTGLRILGKTQPSRPALEGTVRMALSVLD